MEKIAKQSGSEFITLNVNRFNSASIFYIKKGYVIDSEIDIPFGDFWLNDYTMIKKL
jgi:diamine N-acetyltransferase